MPTESEPHAVPVILEWADPTALGLDPETLVATELMMWCAMALGIVALDVSTVRLVVTGDFVESVKQRATSELQQQNYDVRRNSGVVGAKTMSLEDGRIDVLVPAWWFSVEMTEEQRRHCQRLAKRTVIHEAQHVVMAQAGEADGLYEDEPWARRNLLTIADQVIGEYRAEAAVSRELRTVEDLSDCIDVLSTLRDDLERIVMEYQDHLDVARLSYEIGQEVHTAWKLLAYVAAANYRDGSGFEPMPGAITTHPLWQRMVGPHWQAFLDILAKIPPGSERIDREELETSIADLAMVCQTWLESIGFQFFDDDDGISQFLIVEWDLTLDYVPAAPR